MTRIAFLAGHLSRRASGVRQAVEGLSGALAARPGLEVRVFGIDDAAWAGDRALWRGGPAQTLARRGPAALGVTPGLRAALDAFAPDIVHLHGLWMYSAAVAAGWAGATGRPLVISPHGMLAPAALAYSPHRKRLARWAFQDRCFARAAGYHATAPAEAADIRAHLGDVPVATVPNGVEDTAVPRPPWTARARRVVAIGRLHPVKGYDNLLRAWGLVQAAHPDWSLHIAGPDPDGHGADLRALAADLALPRVAITGPVYGAARDALVADSRLFALPSLTENFALTVPEALVCGTPVMAGTGTPWGPLVAAGCGWWTDPAPEALAATLDAALGLPDSDLAAMGARGRDWALAEFAWPGIGARMTAFYDSLTGQP